LLSNTLELLPFLILQAAKDVEDGIPGSRIVPLAGAAKDADIIAAVEANVLSMIEADRKVTALKELQVSSYMYWGSC
jgi:methylthioribulose 1-phosphate dehydratase/enolase-phosphatase E1